MRLLDAENLSGFRLLEAAPFDEALDRQGKLGLQQFLFGMRQAEVGEDISTAFFYSRSSRSGRLFRSHGHFSSGFRGTDIRECVYEYIRAGDVASKACGALLRLDGRGRPSPHELRREELSDECGGGEVGCAQPRKTPPKRSLDGAPLRFKRTRKARLSRQGVCVIWKLGAACSAPNRHKVPRLRSG